MVFDDKRWNSILLDEKAQTMGYVGLYSSVYAIVGIVEVAQVDKVVAVWVDCQEVLVECLKTMSDTKGKDIYLIFVVPVVDKNNSHKIENIINDTQVCRKICIEKGIRSWQEAVGECGIIVSSLGNENTDMLGMVIKDVKKKLKENILEDLSKRSAKTILEKLMDDKY